MFYICRKETRGGAMLWWMENDLGYTSDLFKAKVFTLEQLGSQIASCPKENRNKLAFHEEYITGKSHPNGIVEFKDLDMSQGVKV